MFSFGTNWTCEGNCENGDGTKKWKDGGIEKGTWKNGELIGLGYTYFGKRSEFAGDSYKGEFLHGYHGYGTYIDVSEDATYSGNWKNGKAHGKGKLTFGLKSKYPNRTYEGNWVNGKREGFGVKYFENTGKYADHKYEGEWKNDNFNGLGKYFWPDKGSYIGPWENGVQNGKGVFVLLSGDTLEGEWINGYCETLDSLIKNPEPKAKEYYEKLDQILKGTVDEQQKFIDATTREFLLLAKMENYKVNYHKLRIQLDDILTYRANQLLMLYELQEFDESIPILKEKIEVEKSFDEVLKACDHWINLGLVNAKDSKIEKATDKLFKKLIIMKNQQLAFQELSNLFSEKYDL